MAHVPAGSGGMEVFCMQSSHFHPHRAQHNPCVVVEAMLNAGPTDAKPGNWVFGVYFVLQLHRQLMFDKDCLSCTL